MEMRDFIKILQEYPPETEVINDIWMGADIATQAKDNGVILSSVEIKEVITWVEQHFNAEIGVNWNVIDTAIDEVKNER